MFAYIWEYRVRPGKSGDFQMAYGPEGPWVMLFKDKPGYIKTELLRDGADSERFLTVDYWADRTAFDRFREAFAAEFDSVDRQCEALTESERHLGDFELG